MLVFLLTEKVPGVSGIHLHKVTLHHAVYIDACLFVVSLAGKSSIPITGPVQSVMNKYIHGIQSD